jgi:hypothetical protein
MSRHDLGPSRARNTDDLGVLGDPERWGGAASFSAHVPGDGNVYTFRCEQLIRVQPQDLIARAWDVVGTWRAVKSVGNFSYALLALEVAHGTGQATATGSLLVLTSGSFGLGPPAVIVPGTYFNTQINGVNDPHGTVQATIPHAAYTLAIRGYFEASSDGADIDIKIDLTCAVSPRALTG